MLKDQLEELRKHAGLSQRALSAATGVSHATISRIEAGTVVHVRSETLVKLAGPLNTTVDQLLDFTPQPTTVQSYAVDQQLDQLVAVYRCLPPARRTELVELGKVLLRLNAEKRSTSNADHPSDSRESSDTTEEEPA